MKFNFGAMILTILNFVLLAGGIFLVVKFVKDMTNLYNKSKTIDKKLDKIIELLEKDDKR